MATGGGDDIATGDLAHSQAAIGARATATTQSAGGNLTVGLEIKPQDYATIHERVATLESWRADAEPRLSALEVLTGQVSQQLADARQGFQTSTYYLRVRIGDLDETLHNVRKALELNTSQLEHVAQLDGKVTDLGTHLSADRDERQVRQAQTDADRRWQRHRDRVLLTGGLLLLIVLGILVFIIGAQG
jgi:hypothetical protein